ncbi:MAG: TolC family outer membrane protein [Pseudomonadota bacterium]
MRSALRITFLAALTTACYTATPAFAVDLMQIYNEALANDPVYSAARSALAAGRERDTQGRAGLLPTVTAGGTYTRNDQDIFGQNQRYNNNAYTVQLTQPLLRVANWESYQQGKLSVAASEAQFAQAQQDLIVRVAQAYFDVLTAQDALTFLKAQETAITEQLASAKRNFEVGTATITDANEAEARYDLAIAQQVAAQNDVEVRRAALQQLIGRVPGALSALRAGVTLAAPTPAAVEEWVTRAEQQNFSVVGQQLALEIATREIKRSRAGHYPTVDFIAARSRSSQSGGNSNNPTLAAFTGEGSNNSVGVQWAIPLFSGFAVDSRVRETIALEERARNDVENARRTAVLAVRQSYWGVSNGLVQVRALQAAQNSSQSALESNRLGYQVGVRINIDVLNAQQQLFSTRRDLARARYETILSGLRLKSATGSLREQDLSQINALLTTEAPQAATAPENMAAPETGPATMAPPRRPAPVAPGTPRQQRR